MHYTGVGSRETPVEWCDTFTTIASELYRRYGAILRSGHADGADIAFELGCDNVLGKKEIYLPWRGFNGSDSSLVVAHPKAFETAKQYTPYWGNLKDSVHKLFARNTHQVLGIHLTSPSDFLVCWTPNGKLVGGTRLAIEIADAYDVPIFNAGCYNNYQCFIDDVLQYASTKEEPFK